jgi:hypothetical protein
MSGRRSCIETDATGALIVREMNCAVKRVPASFDADAFYADYVRRFVGDVQRHGRPPETGLAEIARALGDRGRATARAAKGGASGMRRKLPGTDTEPSHQRVAAQSRHHLRCPRWPLAPDARCGGMKQRVEPVAMAG